MIDHDVDMDKYELYAEKYAPQWTESRAWPKLRTGARPKQSWDEILGRLTDDLADIDLGFQPTYKPSRYEAGWLLESLHSFYSEGLITDVLSQVKGGKEASVYCCEAHPATGLGLLAAKVYRPRMFRSLRNDKMYRQGREILVAGGRPAGRDSGYIERAIRSKTGFGQQAAHTSWLMHEFTALERLYEAGAAVPRPIAASDNALLMTYHGDEAMAAPTLNTVHLDLVESESLFREVVGNIDLMLQHDLVHGDLSAYNILYWAAGDSPAEITLIDFPQAVNLRTNDHAHFILQRDIQRTCQYFAGQGVQCDAQAMFEGFWRRYVGEPDAENLAADWSRLAESFDGLAELTELGPVMD